MNVYLNVMEHIGTPSALTQELGDLVYAEICKAIDRKDIIELDFKDIESMISPFLNTAIGKLYEKYSSEEISRFVKLQNVPPEKIPTINVVINNAKRYYANKLEFEKIVRGVTGDGESD